jgi:multimeric flavodoxin WrbA
MDTNFKGLKAIYINCTLKRSPELSHTEGLMKVSMDIMEKEGVSVEMIRFVDFDVPPGVYPDMTEKGWDKDDWVTLSKQVLDADILIIGTPIWLGEKSSVAQKLIERLYSLSGEMNDKGQYIYYGRVGGCVITGNEDGVKHCHAIYCMLYSMLATAYRHRLIAAG